MAKELIDFHGTAQLSVRRGAATIIQGEIDADASDCASSCGSRLKGAPDGEQGGECKFPAMVLKQKPTGCHR